MGRSYGAAGSRHMQSPSAIIQRSSTELPGMLTAIESPENPVYAIKRPAAAVVTPPMSASPFTHLG